MGGGGGGGGGTEIPERKKTYAKENRACILLTCTVQQHPSVKVTYKQLVSPIDCSFQHIIKRIHALIV